MCHFLLTVIDPELLIPQQKFWTILCQRNITCNRFSFFIAYYKFGALYDEKIWLRSLVMCFYVYSSGIFKCIPMATPCETMWVTFMISKQKYHLSLPVLMVWVGVFFLIYRSMLPKTGSLCFLQGCILETFHTVLKRTL